MKIMERVKVVGVKWRIDENFITSDQLTDDSRPSKIEIADWLEAFSNKVLDGNVRLFEALYKLAEETSNLHLKVLTIEIVRGLRVGEDFKDAISSFHWLKIPFVDQLIKFGEEFADFKKLLLSSAKILRCNYELSENSPLNKIFYLGGYYKKFFYELKILLDLGMSIDNAVQVLLEEADASSDNMFFVFVERIQLMSARLKTGFTFEQSVDLPDVFGTELQNVHDQKEIARIISTWFVN